jgi:DNA-binding MarR family transcriptional regulator
VTGYNYDGLNEYRMGYRQRATLAALRASKHPLPTGYIARQIAVDSKTMNAALNGLAARGLARHTRHGFWEASA